MSPISKAALCVVASLFAGLEAGAEEPGNFDFEAMIRTGRVVVCLNQDACKDDELESSALDRFKTMESRHLDFVLANQSTGNIWGIRIFKSSSDLEAIENVRVERFDVPDDVHEQWSDAQHLLN